MAKKKKQKKAGLTKRQSSKQNRKKALKRKELAQRPAGKKQMKRSQAKKNLKQLPSLVFEPELQEILFTPEQISAVTSQYEKTPDQIEAIATDEFVVLLTKALNAMDQRYTKEADANRAMMVKTVLYFMEQDRETAPNFLNQIIVSLFFVAEAKTKNAGVTLDRKELETLLSEYDERWEGYLEEKMEALKQEAQPVIDATAKQHDYKEGLQIPVFAEMLNEFADYLTTNHEISSDQAERIQEDVDVLFNDYFEDKGITSLEGFKARKIKGFVEGWFIRNMHPTQEDLSSLLEALTIISKFLESRGDITSEDSQQVLAYLENRDEIMKSLA